MKKILILAVSIIAAPFLGKADTASVNFATGPAAGLPTALVRGSGGFTFDSDPIHSSDYVAQLLYSTGGGSFSALGVPQPFFTVTPTSVRAGTWKSISLEFPTAVRPGDTVQLKVAVWDSTQFPNWTAVQDWAIAFDPCLQSSPGPVQLGISTAFNYRAPDSSDLNPADYNMSNFSGLTLTAYTLTGPPGICPEPSVMALSAAGLGVLALRWRRV